MNDKVNLLGMSVPSLKAFFAAHGEKPFRAVQVVKWVHQRGMADFEAMTDLAKPLRIWLLAHAEVRTPEVVTEQTSADGTRKWLLRLDDGQCIETVFIPEDDRGTLCVSSQVGCALDCGFCSTARQGFSRNLTAAEIVGQIWVARNRLEASSGAGEGDRLAGHAASPSLEARMRQPCRIRSGQPVSPSGACESPSGGRIVSNVVLMGMGEPLLNFDNVVEAISLMLDDHAYGLSKRRVTVSTAGVVPAIDRLREVADVALALSLHAPDDALRNEIVPLNRKYPIREVLDACRRYVAGRHQRVTVEYVLLDGVNDSPEQARTLVRLLRDLPCKLNLIPFNPFPETRYRRSSPEAVERFRDILVDAGYTTITRRTRGGDIDAACGQLAGKVADRSRRELRFVSFGDRTVGP